MRETEAASRVQARNEARRLEILRAAARVFRRLGLSNAGMREIAQEAGLSPGNLYHYFEGRDALLLFCQQRTLERLERVVDEARASASSARGRLERVLRGHVLVMLDEYEGATAHLEVEALPAALRAPVVARRDAYERAIRSMVARGVSAGEFAPCDPALMTRAMLGAVNWCARWYRPDGAQSPAAIADAMARYLVGGLLPARVRGSGGRSGAARAGVRAQKGEATASRAAPGGAASTRGAARRGAAASGERS